MLLWCLVATGGIAKQNVGTEWRCFGRVIDTPKIPVYARGELSMQPWGLLWFDVFEPVIHRDSNTNRRCARLTIIHICFLEGAFVHAVDQCIVSQQLQSIAMIYLMF